MKSQFASYDFHQPIFIRTLFFLFAFWVVSLNGEALEGAQIPQISPIDSLVYQLVLKSWVQHPDLKAMESMISADSARAVMLRGWMNPDLTLGIMDLPISGKLHQMEETAFRFGIMQKVPFPGKLKLASEWGIKAQNLTLSRWVRARYEMAGMVMMNFFDLMGAIGVKKVLKEEYELMKEMAESAQIMFASGMGTLSDYQRALFDVSFVSSKIVTQESLIQRKLSLLIYALGESQDRESLIPQTELPPPPDPKGLSLDSLLTGEVIENTPEVKVAFHYYQWTIQGLAKVRRDYYPDFNFMFTYDWRTYVNTPADGAPMNFPFALQPDTKKKLDDMIGLEVSVVVPLFYRRNQQAQIAEMQAMVREAEFGLQDARIKKRDQIRQLYARWWEAHWRAEVALQQLIPVAQGVWEARMADYRGGRVDYMALQESGKMLIEAKMEAQMAVADAWMARGLLLTSLGHPRVEGISDWEGRER
ncbi:MAG: TolC family protein [bacterium]